MRLFVLDEGVVAEFDTEGSTVLYDTREREAATVGFAVDSALYLTKTQRLVLNSTGKGPRLVSEEEALLHLLRKRQVDQWEMARRELPHSPPLAQYQPAVTDAGRLWIEQHDDMLTTL